MKYEVVFTCVDGAWRHCRPITQHSAHMQDIFVLETMFYKKLYKLVYNLMLLRCANNSSG